MKAESDMEIRIKDKWTSDAVNAWVFLDGLDAYDCVITDSEEITATASRPTVYLSSLGTPPELGKLSEAVRASAVSKADEEICTGSVKKPSAPVFSPVERTVSYGGKVVRLTGKEYALLGCLAKRAGSVVSRDEIRENVFGGETDSDSNAADVYVSYLRRKTEPLFGKGAIISVRGEGYMLKLPSEK